MHERIAIPMPEGQCPAHLFTPGWQGPDRQGPDRQGKGPWPAVIFYMDGLAIRPALFAMAQRLADGGYVVLLPDLFYRAGPYAPLDPQAVFAAGSARAVIGPLMASTDRTRAAQDTAAFLACLDARGEVAPGGVGAVGYCMGGGIALAVAAAYPDRFAAIAAFQATDEADSPHLLAPNIKARVYVGGADQDASYPPEMAERLDQALTSAGLEHLCEIYPGAAHGWTMADFPIYNEAAAERHWQVLFDLLANTLK